MQENDVIDRMIRLLNHSEPNEHGVAMHGHWSQCRCDYFQLFKRMNDAGLDVPENFITDRLGLYHVDGAAMRRWEQDVTPAWSEWRYAWGQFNLSQAHALG
jgi:hypothetical protein